MRRGEFMGFGSTAASSLSVRARSSSSTSVHVRCCTCSRQFMISVSYRGSSRWQPTCPGVPPLARLGHRVPLIDVAMQRFRTSLTCCIVHGAGQKPLPQPTQ